MNIWTHKYQLNLKGRHISGALLKFNFQQGNVGYSCLQTWEELGDLSLQAQLKNLINADLNSVLKQAFYFAQIDAQARSQNKNIFEELKLPESHCLFFNFSDLCQQKIEEVRAQGFKLVKLKVGKNAKEEIGAITAIDFKTLELRLDFNVMTSFEEVSEFLLSFEKNVGNLELIDLVEDPCPAKNESWKKLKDRFKIKVAADREISGYAAADIIVIKPTIQNVDEIVQLALNGKKKIYFTTNLDHAIGVKSAMYEAGRILKAYPELVLASGLLSHNNMGQDRFFAQMQINGPVFELPKDIGLGFDKELSALKWDFLL